MEASFNEFHTILCRNVMIYFNRSLQRRVHSLVYQSLGMRGALGLGLREALTGTPYEKCYEPLDSRGRLYRKVR
jgi:chemotaxis protein methyltransferase CheR